MPGDSSPAIAMNGGKWRCSLSMEAQPPAVAVSSLSFRELGG